MYLLDTNAIIYYTDDEAAAVTVLETIFSANQQVYISTLTELELFSHARYHAKTRNGLTLF